MEPITCLPRAALSRTVTVLLASGRGGLLHELTHRMPKAALPLFATQKGPLRLVDFTMANIVRSGLSRLVAATQYRPETLEVHLGRRWAPLFPGAGLTVRNGTMTHGGAGYGGTVDAVAANRVLIDEAAPREVLVVAGDQIGQMDYSALIATHRAGQGAVTLAVYRAPQALAAGGSVISRDAGGLITAIAGHPATAGAGPQPGGTVLLSTGAMVFDWAWLRSRLPNHPCLLDFGRDLLPEAVAAGGAQSHDLPAMPGQAAPYWRGIETLDNLRSALLDFAATAPCHVPVLPGAPFRLSGIPEGDLRLAAPFGPRLTQSVVLPGARVAPGARLSKVIVAPGTMVPADLQVGRDAEEDAHWFRRTDYGTVLITNAMLARRSGRVFRQLRDPLLSAFYLPPLAS